jgi:hypothetical protein
MEKLPPHPSRPMAFALLGLGSAAMVGGVAASVPAVSILGATAGVLGLYQWRMGIAATTANHAAAAINRGELDRARVLVTRARAEHRMTYVHRLLDSHESEIAWREGDLAAAEGALEAGRARKDLLPYGAWRKLHIIHLDALLALVRAIGGDERAEELIARVRSAPSAQPGPLARVELAHAMLLARRGDLNALHQQLMRHHVLLSEGLEARGRALHRVLRRMTATRSTSAYRLPVKNAPPPKQGASASWMSRVFPQGTEHVELEDGGVVPLTDVGAKPPAPVAPVRAQRLGLRIFLIVVILVVLVFLLMALGGGEPGSSFNAIVWLFLVLVVGAVALNVRRARSGTRAIEEAQRALICGELDRAEAIARPLRDHQNRVLGASAALILAGVLERRSELTGALAECERGIGLLTGLMKMGTSDVLLPQLIATRAYLFGALGRDGESEGELARLARDYPAFPYAPGMVLRTRLIRAARGGDLATARELARARGDVSVGAYGELIAELVLAIDAEDREERIAAVREDLAALPEADRWIRAVAPGLLERALAK